MNFLTTHIRIDLTYVHDHQDSALNLIKKHIWTNRKG